jgi:RNA polymerase sigma factor (sigma-70 family)
MTKELVEKAVGGDRAALEQVMSSIRDDVFHLGVRMLGNRIDAEDAAQEILIQVMTHLGQWRGEASFRTWVWTIATRHILRRKKSKDENECSFEALEGLIAAGEANQPMPRLNEAELTVLEEELRLACTEGMLLSIDRDHRIAWILSETFELSSDDGAAVLGIEPAAFRKRVQRARERLGTWMNAHCGLVNAVNACCCRRQIPIALEVGAINPTNLQFAEQPVKQKKRLTLAQQADEVERAKHVLCSCPEFVAPEAMITRLKALIASGDVQLMS